MSGLTKLSLLTQHLQYVGLLRKVEIPFPKNFFEFTSISQLFNFDPEYLWNVVAIPRLSFRMLFIGVAVMCPLLLMLLTAMVFFTLRKIMLFCMVIIGVIMISARIVYEFVPDEILPPELRGQMTTHLFLMLGISLVGSVILDYLIDKLFSKMKAWRFNAFFTGQMLPSACVFLGMVIAGVGPVLLKVVVCGLALFALLSLGRNKMNKGIRIILALLILGAAIVYAVLIDFSHRHCGVGCGQVPLPVELHVPGLVLALIGCLQHMVEMLESRSSSGVGLCFMNLRNSFQRILDTGLLALCFFGLQIAFVPVVVMCLEMYLCSDYSCPEGTKFNPFAERPPETYTTSHTFFCDDCNFARFDPSCAFSQPQLCPAFTSQRLLMHPDTRCDDAAYELFSIASHLVLFVFVVVVNLLNRAVIQTCTDRLTLRAQWLNKKNKVDYQKYLQHSTPFDEDAAVVKAEKANAEKFKKFEERKLAEAAKKRSAVDIFLDGDDQDPFADTSGTGGLLDETFDPLGILSPSSKTPQRKNNPDAPVPIVIPKRKKKIKKVERKTVDEFYADVAQKTNPKAAQTYQPYRLNYRFFFLVEQFHKLAVVLANVIIAPVTAGATVVNLVAHVGNLLILALLAPYSDRLEQHMSAALAGCDAFNAAYTVAVWQDPVTFGTPEWGLAMVIINVVLPVTIACILGYVVAKQFYQEFCKKNKETEEEKKSKDRRRKLKKRQKEMEEDEQEMLTMGLITKDQMRARSDTVVQKEDGESSSDSEDEDGNKKLPKEEDPDLEAAFEKANTDKDGKVKKTLVTPNEVLTEQINKSTKKIVLRYFVYFAVPFLIVAMALTIFAQVKKTDAAEFIDASDLYDRSTSHVLGGKKNWSDFTTSCCCMGESKNPPKRYNISERWVCMNVPSSTAGNVTTTAVPQTGPTLGMTVNRGRLSSDLVDDGRPLRGVCQQSFHFNCSVVIQDGRAVLGFCNNTALEAFNVTHRAKRVFW